MKTEPSSPNQHSEIFIDAIEQILRQVTRLVVGKVGFPKYLSLVRKIFVEEAELILKEKSSDEKVTMTELGLITGIDTRTLSKIRKSENYSKPIIASKAFFTDLTPEATVLDAWTSNPKYLDDNSRKPIPLTVWGEGKTFESLVNSTIKSRGITVQSILNRLSRTNYVSFTDDEKVVQLQTENWLSIQKSDATALVKSGLFGVCKHLDTVHHNIKSVREPIPPLVERVFWSTRIDPMRLEEFRESMKLALEASCEVVFDAMRPFDENFDSKDSMSGGFGFYYFDSDSW